jgi:hypothetical protein
MEILEISDDAGPEHNRSATPPIVHVYDRLMNSKSPDCTPWGLPNPWNSAGLRREDSIL